MIFPQEVHKDESICNRNNNQGIARKISLTRVELAEKLNVSDNMMRSKVYVCPVCGNSIHSMGEAVIQCHGIMLNPCQTEETDDEQTSYDDGEERKALEQDAKELFG